MGAPSYSLSANLFTSLSLSLPLYLSLTNFLNPDPKWNGLTTSLSLSLSQSLSEIWSVYIQSVIGVLTFLSLSLSHKLSQSRYEMEWKLHSFSLSFSLSLFLTNDLNLCPKWNLSFILSMSPSLTSLLQMLWNMQRIPMISGMPGNMCSMCYSADQKQGNDVKWCNIVMIENQSWFKFKVYSNIFMIGTSSGSTSASSSSESP